MFGGSKAHWSYTLSLESYENCRGCLGTCNLRIVLFLAAFARRWRLEVRACALAVDSLLLPDVRSLLYSRHSSVFWVQSLKLWYVAVKYKTLPLERDRCTYVSHLGRNRPARDHGGSSFDCSTRVILKYAYNSARLSSIRAVITPVMCPLLYSTVSRPGRRAGSGRGGGGAGGAQRHRPLWTGTSTRGGRVAF